MDLAVALATFAVIFPAELPDKSMFASIVLATRFRPLPVWIGLATAFGIHVLIAVLAGSALGLLPEKLVLGIVTLFFTIGASFLLFTKESEESAEGKERAAATSDATTSSRIAATAFGVIFVSEWGDLTQMATVNLTASYDDPLSVGAGAVAALWLITGLGVFAGRKIIGVLSLELVRKVSGLVLAVLAIWSLIDFLHA